MHERFRDEFTKEFSATAVEAWIDDLADKVQRGASAYTSDRREFRCFHHPTEEIAANMCVDMACCPRDQVAGCPLEAAPCSLCEKTMLEMASTKAAPSPEWSKVTDKTTMELVSYDRIRGPNTQQHVLR